MQQQIKIAGFTGALRGTAVQQRAGAGRPSGAAARQAAVTTAQAATITTRKLKASQAKPPPPPPPPARKTVAGTASKTVVGTKPLKGGTLLKKAGGTQKTGTQSVGGTRKIKAIEVFSTEKQFRQKQQSTKPTPKILSRIEQLKLLSKLEQSGLLSALEKSGVTLSKLEQSGVLSTAEKLGAVSLLADRNVPGALYTLASALLVAGPAAVYFLPDDSATLVALQVVIAATCVAGGSAAWGGASLLSTLQKS